MMHVVGVVLVIGIWGLWYFSPADNDHILGVAGGLWALCQVCAGLLTWWFRL